jgi:hypothetical protein
MRACCRKKCLPSRRDRTPTGTAGKLACRTRTATSLCHTLVTRRRRSNAGSERSPLREPAVLTAGRGERKSFWGAT